MLFRSLLTLANLKTNNFKELRQVVEKAYGQDITIFKTNIPRAVTAEEAPASGTSIYLYDGSGKVAMAYEEFTKELLESGDRNE